MRGNAMSGAPIISGTSQLPKPPIMAGMIMKNTMIRPWPVTNTLKVCGSLKTCRPGIHQLGAHHHREEAADAARARSRRSGTSCRCPCGSSNRRSAASRWDDGRGRRRDASS